MRIGECFGVEHDWRGFWTAGRVWIKRQKVWVSSLFVRFPRGPFTTQDIQYETKVVPLLHVLVTSSQMTS